MYSHWKQSLTYEENIPDLHVESASTIDSETTENRTTHRLGSTDDRPIRTKQQSDSLSNEAARKENFKSQSGLDLIEKINAKNIFSNNNSPLKKAHIASPSSELTQMNPTEVDSIKSSNYVKQNYVTSNSKESVKTWLTRSNPSSQSNAGLAGTRQVDYWINFIIITVPILEKDLIFEIL